MISTMTTWSPITQTEIEQLLLEQLASCNVEERSAFEGIRTPLRAVPILRMGKIESVFVVGEHDDNVLIFEDIEQGFEWCRPDPDGVIRNYACSQSGLQGRLHDLLEWGVDRLLLPLTHPHWQSFKGGYRVTYDASPRLRKLLNDGPDDELWDEFWTELHHQGDLHQASYAAVPWLVEFIRRSPKLDWNAVALIATIELERDQHGNPPVALDLQTGYHAAIRALPKILGTHPDQEWDEDTTRSAVACIALARGQRWIARAYFEMDRDTAGRWFSEEFGWNFPDVEPRAT